MTWHERVKSEQPLDVQDALRLDESLEATSSVRTLVQSLADDEPSLAWRSELNEKLMGARRPARGGWRLWLPVGGSAVAAACLALAFFRPSPEPTTPVASANESNSVEAIILQSHREADATTVLGVASPAPSRPVKQQVFDWSQLERS